MMKCGLCNGRREVAHFTWDEGWGYQCFCDTCLDCHKKAQEFNGGPGFKLISREEYEIGIISESVNEDELLEVLEGVDPERIRETFAKIGAEIADRMIWQQVMES